MIGCYDFCAHYEWTFEWLKQQGGEPLVHQFWEEAIGNDSQSHASELIKREGFKGMEKYWAHTLVEEGAGYVSTAGEGVMRLDIHECPSKGFLIRNQLEQYHDYCDHCIGWIGPVMKNAGFQIHHEHNHRGKCWWEFRRSDDTASASLPTKLSGENDVRSRPDWVTPETHLDRFEGATGPLEKTIDPGEVG